MFLKLNVYNGVRWNPWGSILPLTLYDPALLIMDGHMTHTKNLDVINLARENHVTILILPPHCSHRMQPLDVSFMKPLNAYYVKAIETFLRNNPGRVVTIYKLSALFGEAYLQAAVPNTAINGFKKAGIFPVNRQVFDEADFLPAHPTDRPIPFDGEQEEENQDDPVAPLIMPLEDISDVEESVAPTVVRNLFKPGSSPKDIIPLPKVTTILRKKRPRPQGRAFVMTASPYKAELESENQKKKEKDLALAQKRQKREDKEKLAMTASNKQPKKRMTKQKQKPKEEKARPSRAHDSDSSDNEEGESTLCLYCNDTFGNSVRGEGWVCCAICKHWAHEQCAGVDDDDEEEAFVCDLCQN